MESVNNETIQIPFNRRNVAKIDGFTVLKKTERVFHINDGTGSFVTLIIGSSSALLVDTSWGIKDLPKLVEKLLPLKSDSYPAGSNNTKGEKLSYSVVNTHCHPDHCWGNFQFEKVLVPEKDTDVYAEIKDYSENREEYFQKVEGAEERFRSENQIFPPLEFVREGDIFNLGDITVEAVPLYSHTHGSLGFFVREEKLLLAGDAITTGVWLFMKESLPLEECRKTFEKIKKYDFERILGSHAKVFWSKNLIDAIILNIDNVLKGNLPENPETEEIMGYKTAAFYAEFKDASGWITVPWK